MNNRMNILVYTKENRKIITKKENYQAAKKLVKMMMVLADKVHRHRPNIIRIGLIC